MTTQTLDRVTLQSLENYRTAATQAVAAYRVGGRRLVGVIDGALKNSVYPRTAKLAPRATDRMDQVRGSVSEIVVKGIDQVAERADQAIALSSTTAAQQVSKVAKFAAGIDNAVVASGLQAAARLTMPGAQVALLVSDRVVKGANALAGIAGARPLHKAVRKAVVASKRKAAPVARKSKALVQTTSRRVAQVAKAAPAPVAKAQRAVRSAKKAATRAVAA